MSEDQNIEWKSSWRDEYLKWVCGFANAQGGVLEIGKNDQGVPTPELRYEHTGLWVEFKYPKTSEKMSEKTPDRILALLREDPYLTISALSERIGKTGRTIERNLSSLQKAGRLKRIGPDKGGKWQVL